MVAIVSGNSLGLSLTSLATLGQRGVFGNAGGSQAGELAYVNIATGNLILQGHDNVLVARGQDAAAIRTYNSQGQLADDNWGMGVSNAKVRLVGTPSTAGSTVIRMGPDGAESVYAFNTTLGLYVSTDGSGAYDRIKYDAAAGQLIWTDGDTGVSERYQASGAGRLLSTTDLSGNTLTYAYASSGSLASVTTASGETTYFDYSGNKLSQVRTEVQDGAGRKTLTSVRYAYDTQGRLAAASVDLSPSDNSIADGKVYTTSYTYDGSSTRIASISQSDGTRLSFGYVQVGTEFKIASVVDAQGQKTLFAYDTVNRKTVVTDPLGFKSSYEYDTKGQLTKVTAPPVGGVSSSTTYVYSATGDVLSVTDSEGRVVTMEYDTNGNQALQRDSAGNTVMRTFNDRNQVLSETVYVIPDPDGSGAQLPLQPLTTRYVYDAIGRNQLRFVVSPEGRVTEYRYNAAGEQTTTVQYTEGQYAVAGLAQTEVPAESTLAAWAVSQNLTKTTRTDLAYDYRGQLQKVTTYGRVDASGSGVIDGTQTSTQYVYDHSGQLLQTVSAKNGVTQYVYDGLGRVIATTNALNEVTLTQYDAANNRTTVKHANGLSTISSYDSAGRLISLIQTDAASIVLGATQYFYDANNRLRMTQDPTGVRQWSIYDEAGRKTALIDGNGSLVEYVYDKNNQLIQTIAYATAVNVSGLVDAQGKPTEVTLASIRPATNASDRKIWRIYDDANRLVKQIDALGAVTEIRYDGVSRVVATIRYATLANIASLGSNPTAASIVPAASTADRIVRNIFDNDGLLQATLDGEGFLTKYRYNSAGKLVETVAYATATPAAARAAGTLAELTPTSNANDIRTVRLYNARGQLAGVVDAEGYLTETVYDENGNATRTVRYATKITANVTTTVELSSLRPVSNAEDQVVQKTFDGLNRLIQQTDAQGVVTQYEYDKAGNLVRTIAAAGTSEVRTLTAKYDLQGRLIGELSAEGAAKLTGNQTQAQIDAIWVQYGISHVYDAAGRRISSTNALGQKTLFFYDVDSHLTHTINALGEVEAREYTTLGQLNAVIQYGTRIPTAGLTGGLVTSALQSLLAGIKNVSLDSKTTVTYNKVGAVATETDALAFTTTHQYNAFGDETSLTKKLDATRNLIQQFSYDRRGLQTAVRADASGLNVNQTTQYDAFGRPVRFVDGNGNIRTQSFDRLGRSTAIKDPLNGLTKTIYDAFDRVLTEVDALGSTTRYAYSTANRSVTVTTAEGIAVVTTRTRHGQVLSVKDGRGNVTSYTYDRNGNLTKTATPLNQNSSVYDAASRLIETTDAKGVKTSYAYDAANRVLTKTFDPAGLKLVTSYTYDAKGQNVTTTNPTGIVTQLIFNLKGQVLKRVVDPAGLNLTTQYSYDGAGKTLTVINPGGTAVRYVYDVLGRRTEERVDPAGLNLISSYTYDKNGNVLSKTDPNGNKTRFVYDANDRLVFTLDPLGKVTQNIYDAEDRIIRVTSYAKPIILADLPTVPVLADIQSRVLVSAGQDAVDGRVYDKDGRQTWSVDGTGAVKRYIYDAAGNVIEQVSYVGKIDLATWVSGTVPTPTANPSDKRVRTVYDALNRATFSIDGIGAVVAYKYDSMGNVLERTAYAKAVPSATAATADALAQAVALIADATHDARVRQMFDTANRVVWSADGMGAVTRKIYDKNGNLLFNVAFANKIAANVQPNTVTTSVADRVTAFAYDAANRLVFQVNSLGGVVRNVYDANGNVVQQIAYAKSVAPPSISTALTLASVTATLAIDTANDRTTRHSYDAANREVYTVDAQGAVTESRYDAAGNVVEVRQYAAPISTSGLSAAATPAEIKSKITVSATNDRVNSYAYDASNQRVYSVDAQGYVTLSVFDGVGRLSSTTQYALTVPATAARTLSGIAAAIAITPAKDRTVAYTYDAAGHVISTKDALGASEAYTYDSLGRKLSFTNKLGATWRYTYDAAGRLLTETAPPVELTVLNAPVTGTPLTISPSSSLASVSIVTRMQYDALGNLLSRTEAAGLSGERTTVYEYDALGRQIKTIFPPVGVYNPNADALASNGASTTAARIETVNVSLSVSTYYDAFGNAVMNRDVAGNLSFKTYDLLGQVAFEVDAQGYITAYARNAFGQVTGLTRYAQQTTLASSNSAPLSNSQIRVAIDAVTNHGSDRTIFTDYDQVGRVVLVTEPQAYVYDVNASGAVTSAFSGKKTRSAYNAFGDLVSIAVLKNASTDAWSTTVHYYDRVGNQTASVDAKGYLTTRQFDGARNLAGVIEYASAITGWNAGAAPEAVPTVEADTSDRKVIYEYDQNNRKTTETRFQVQYSVQSNGTVARGNLVTKYGYDAVGNTTSTTDAIGATTYTAYDALGRITAVTAPERLVGAVLVSPLTVFRRDAYGNVVATIEYAAGAAASDRSKPAAAGADDRMELNAYDSHGHVTQSTDANGNSRYFSYDVRGNIAKEWVPVTGNDGVTRTLFKAYEYDKAGRLTNVREPSSTTVLAGGLSVSAPSSSAINTDEDGRKTLTGNNSIKVSWSGLIDAGGGAVRIQVDYKTQSTLSPAGVSESGQPLYNGVASHLASRVQDIAANAAAGGWTFGWADKSAVDGGVSTVEYIRVWQQDSAGNWISKWDGTRAQAQGAGVTTVAQEVAGLTDSSTEYNAFGEIIAKGVNGGRQEYFDYDNAGRVWRTNSGDGIDKVMLYDVQGRNTEEIRSAGAINLKVFQAPEVLASVAGLRRTNLVYDDLGRVVQKIMPNRQESQGGVSVQPIRTNTSFNSASVVFDESSVSYWAGTNQINLAWNSLAQLGSGDVKVLVEYYTQSYAIPGTGGTNESGYVIPPTIRSGIYRTKEQIFSATGSATGVSMSWSDGSGVDGGVSKVGRVRVYKKDVNGNWQSVIDRDSLGNSGNEIQVSAPTDPQTRLILQIRTAGSSGDAGWTDAPLVNFGNALRYDASALPGGNYEYRVRTTTTDGVTRVTATGTLSLGALALASIGIPLGFGAVGQGIFAWQSPGTGIIQTFRYRPAGSTGAWTTVAVASRGKGYDGVDLNALAGGGSFQYELLWTRAGEVAPYAHATGAVNVTAAVPAQWVPPQNLRNISGVSFKWAKIEGVADESGVIYGGRWAYIVEWPLAPAGTQASFFYRAAGGTWSTLPITTSYTSPVADESGNRPGVQYVDVGGLGANTYDFQVLFTKGGAPDSQATGVINIYARNPGYWETRTVAVTRTRTVTPLDPSKYLSGYNEAGQPVYSWPVYEGYNENGSVILGKGYGYNRWGVLVAIPYTEKYTAYESQQFWVEGAIPPPKMGLNTPAYVPGYTIPGRLAQFSANVTTAASSGAISQNSSIGAILAQAATLNGVVRDVRPTVFQEFDRWGNLVSLTDPRNTGWKTTYTYNANNQLIRESKPDANGYQSVSAAVTEIFYDQLGRQVAVKDGRGYVNGVTYDAGGNVKQEIHADGGVINNSYNLFGDKTQVIDAMGKLITNGYDKLGRMTSITRGSADVFGVNASMALVGQGSRAIVERYGYDQAGRLIWQTNGAGEKMQYAYDPRGNIVETRLANAQIKRSVFDTQGRKIAESDENGFAATWAYDYFGLLIGHTDLGGAKFTYRYDSVRQLIQQTSTRGQNLVYSYDAAGQVLSVLDRALNQETVYAYDASGRSIREITKNNGTGSVYQDNYLAYDARGYLRNVSDGRVNVVMEYDMAGNRWRIFTSVINSADKNMSTDRYFQYDAMNRQTIVDAIDTAGNINVSQGHIITYDKNGNRATDTVWGKKVTATQKQTGVAIRDVWAQIGSDENGLPIYGYTESAQPIYKTVYTAVDGPVTETYAYDELDRLKTISRDGTLLDTRYYDAASRVVQSGPNGRLDPAYVAAMNGGGIGNGSETRVNRYGANGQLEAQRVLKSDNSLKYDLNYTSYDKAGNLLQYSVTNYDGSRFTNTFNTSLVRFDGYKEGSVSGTSTKFQPGTTTSQYDANGHLSSIVDSTKPASNRTFVNDSQGHALLVNQGGRIQRQLVVNGEVLGRYGEALDANANNGSFIQIADFNFGYQPISGNYPSASPGVYIALAGDNLKTIAQGAYGDSKLWYRIAEANGLSGDADLRVGQALTIPAGVTANGNDATTFKPYDPTKITGDTTPNLPVPKADKGCGGVGQLIMVVVAVVATIYTAGLASGASGAFTATMNAGVATMGGATAGAGTLAASLGTVGTGMAAAAVGSVASQAVGNLIGAQNGFSWKGVALSAIGGGITAGLGGSAIPSTQNAIVDAAIRGAAGNALSQGIGVVTGLQSSFSWRSVAASAVGGGVGQAVGQVVGGAVGNTDWSPFTKDLVTRGLAGLAGGLAAAVMRGGKVSVQQVALDSFGNALGSSLAAAMSSPGTQENSLYSLNDGRSGQGLQAPAGWGGAGWSSNSAGYDQLVGAFSNPRAVDRSNDVLLAAGPGYSGMGDRLDLSNGLGSGPVNSNIINTLTARKLELQRNIAGLNALSDEVNTSPAYLPDVGYADENNTFPAVTIRASRDSLYDWPINGAGNGLRGPDYGSMTPIGVVEGFFTFKPEGRALKGVGTTAFDYLTALPNALRGLGTLAGDAYGYASNAIAPQRSVLTGQPFAYQPKSAVLQSIQQQGMLGTLGAGITSAVRNAPGIGLIGALGAPNRDWSRIGGQAFNLGAVAAGSILGGRAVGSTESAGAQRTVLSTTGVAEQARLASSMVPGLSETQARLLLDGAFNPNKPVEVVLGGSRVRSYFGEGTFRLDSDLDIGFNAKMKNNQVDRILDAFDAQGPLQSERGIRIFSGNNPPSGPIISPQEFFQRSGIRGPFPPERAGQPFGPSGFISFHPDGTITIVPPGGGL